MPMVYYSNEQLANLGFRKVKESGCKPIVEATLIIEDKWEILSEEDRKILASRGLAHLIADLLLKERTTVIDETKPSYTRVPINLPPLQRDKRVSDLNQVHYLIKNDEKFRGKVLDIHKRIYGDGGCGKKMCYKRNGSPDYEKTLNCVSLYLFDNIYGIEIIGITIEEVDAIIIKRKDDKIKYEKNKEWWDHLHDLMRCQNITCKEGRYKSTYGHCAEKFFSGYKTKEEQERVASAWGERQRRWDEDRFNRINGWINMAVMQGYKQAMDDMKSITLIASDGVMKDLTKFSLEDVKYWANRSDVTVRGWIDRRTWFDTAQRLLEQYRCDTIEQLPQEEFRKLGQLANDVWKQETTIE